MNTRIEFQYTSDDLEEAAQAMAAENLRQRTAKMKKQSPIARVIVPIVVPVVALLLLGNMNWGKIDAYGFPRPPFFVVINLILPGVVFSGFLLAMALNRRRAGVRGYSRTPLLFFVMSLFPLVMIGASMYVTKHWLDPRIKAASSIRDGQYDWFAMIIPHVTWAGILGFIVLINGKQVKNRAKESWESNPALQRPRTVDITEADITIDEVIGQSRMQWVAYMRLIETKNLFLLCPSEGAFEMIPKRAFGSREAIDAARAFFHGRIVDREKAGHAFTVVAPQPVTAIES